jgi:hypothetical protein
MLLSRAKDMYRYLYGGEPTHRARLTSLKRIVSEDYYLSTLG